MSERMSPLPLVCPIYEHDWSDYPDKVRVSMDDGKVVDYIRDIHQPNAKSALKEMLDQFTAVCYGGQKYKEKGRGKRLGRRQQWVSE